MIAVMAKYNPFAEKAGMKKILESKPNPAILDAVEKLRKAGLQPGFPFHRKIRNTAPHPFRCIVRKAQALKESPEPGLSSATNF